MGHGTKSSTKGAHVRLSPRTIITAALAIVDRDGADALTMRNLGLELCVDPTAVYRHFRDKDELLVAMADQVLAGVVQQMEPIGNWRERLLEMAIACYRAYLSHPSFARILSLSPEVLESHERLTEIALGAFRAAGLSPAEAALAHHAFVNYVAGVGSLDGELVNHTPDYEAWRRSYVLLPEDRFPNCVAVAPHLYPGAEPEFRFGLNLMLDGVEVRARSRLS
jgi:TetR/AcrR family transcriptional regulator, tetracycline repressor protein